MLYWLLAAIVAIVVSGRRGDLSPNPLAIAVPVPQKSGNTTAWM